MQSLSTTPIKNGCSNLRVHRRRYPSVSSQILPSRHTVKAAATEDEKLGNRSSTSWLDGAKAAFAGALVAGSLLATPASTMAIEEGIAAFSGSSPVYDGARIVASSQRAELEQELKQFEESTGWRVRVYTCYSRDQCPSEDALRSQWRPDKRTVIINFDPSNPNLTRLVHLGDEVLAKLRNPWWFELQGRYGNMFYVRDEGESAAIAQTMAAITTCLGAPEGCKVVPGVASDQEALCALMAAAGGIIAGGASRIEPQGFVKSRWVWLALFSPLWASLYINFSIAPIITRTSDPTPVAINTAVFALCAASPYILSALLRAAPPPGSNPSSPQ